PPATPVSLKISVLHYQPGGEPMDPVVGHIVKALEDLRHQPTPVGVHERVHDLLKSLEKTQPDLVFNVCETFADDDRREVYVGVLGTPTRAEILPIVELDFGKWDPSQPKVSDRDVKFGPESEGSPKLKMATELSADLQARIERAALLAYRALKISDYARVDFRVSAKNEPYVLEVNPNPYLENQSELAMGARERGLSYTQLIGRIVESACNRYGLKLKEKTITDEVPAPG